MPSFVLMMPFMVQGWICCAHLHPQDDGFLKATPGACQADPREEEAEGRMSGCYVQLYRLCTAQKDPGQGGK